LKTALFKLANKIITRIVGGLGNQMFRYAAGKALALEHDAELVLDTSLLIKHAKDPGDYVLRNFELDIFPEVKEKVIDMERQRLPLFLRSVLKKITGVYPVFKETTFSYDAKFWTIKPPVVIHGDWQTELYFKKYETAIRQSFRFPELGSNDLTHAAAEKIKASTAVSVHVRRGDYLNQSILQLNGVCPQSYYESAISILQQQIPDAIFYFFSDDPAWVREHLTGLTKKYYVVEGNSGGNAWKDMYLMSICKHHIIANSSFSWWAAWLNDNSEKLVIAPQKWFASEDPYYDTKDIIPASWHKI
jgi:hypothetical protein